MGYPTRPRALCGGLDRLDRQAGQLLGAQEAVAPSPPLQACFPPRGRLRRMAHLALEPEGVA